MQVEFDPVKGMISFHDPGLPGQSMLVGSAWVRYRNEGGSLRQADLTANGCYTHEEVFSDVHGTGRQLIIHCPPDPHGIELTCRLNTYDQQSFNLFQLSVRNLSREPVRMLEFCPLQADPAEGGQVHISEAARELRFFKVGWHGWDFSGLRTSQNRNTNSWLDAITSTSYTNPVTPRIRARGKFWSEGWGILAEDSAAVVAGFVSTAHQFGQVYACTHTGQAAMKLITQADGILLDPGETCESEWGFLQLVPLPNTDPAADFVDTVARQMHARLPASPPPPMWTHWYQFYHDITEDLFLQNLDALTEQRPIVPYQVVELDDGYQSFWGDWTSTNTKFPRGLEWLAGQISRKGFTPGLWLAPFQVQAKSVVAREHPDWLVKNKNGKPIHAGFQYNMFMQALDATHPAVLEHLWALADKLSHQWGYGLLKLDFINAGALPGKRYNPKLTRAQALRLGLEALRQGAGEQTFLLGSGCPFGPAIGVVDAMRIGPDTDPSWEPFFHWLSWAGPLIKKEPSMPSLRNAIRHTLNLSVLHQRWWWNDPDCLLARDTDTHLTEPEVLSAVTLVGLSGGMLVSSDDLRKLNPDRLGWVSLLVPNLGIRGSPLGLLKNLMPEGFQVRLTSLGQSWQEVGIFNWSDQPADCSIRFEELGYTTGTTLHIFDFWTRQYRRLTDPVMVFPAMPAHGRKLLRVCEVREAPQLVGDTLHISQGAEIASWQVEENKLVIATMGMGRRVDGKLWLALVNPPRAATCNEAEVDVEDIGEGIYGLHVRFTGKGRIEVGW
jgi:alpha-galactosidase